MAGSERVSRVEGMKISAWLYAVIRIPVLAWSQSTVWEDSPGQPGLLTGQSPWIQVRVLDLYPPQEWVQGKLQLPHSLQIS